MKVTLREKGGLAFLRFRPRALDVENLSEVERREFHRLLDAVQAAPAPREAPADAMSYEVEIEDDEGLKLLRSSGGDGAAWIELASFMKKRAGRR